MIKVIYIFNTKIKLGKHSVKESKLSQNRDIGTKKAHMLNLIKSIPTLVKRGAPAHQ